MDQLLKHFIDMARENMGITSLLLLAVLTCVDNKIKKIMRRKDQSKGRMIVIAACGGKIIRRSFMVPTGRMIEFAVRGQTLDEACSLGDVEQVKFLINEGADIHVDHEWPLREAIKNHHVEVIKLLVDAGADIHANDDQALQWCAEQAALDNYAQQVIPERASSDLAACIEACIFLVQKGSDIEAIRRCDCEDIYNLVARVMLKEQLETELKKDESPQPARRMKI